MAYVKLNAYRVPINVSILDSSAQKLLTESKEPEALLESAGWSPEHLEFVRAGLAPVKDSRKFSQMMKDLEVRAKMKEERTAKGYPDWITPRKGFQGWMQRKFKDPKELALPILLDVFAWLRDQPRYQLLVALHDVLLGQVSSAEPRLVGNDYQLNEFVHPLTEMAHTRDAARVEKFRAALGGPLAAVPPPFLVDDVIGYVVSFDRKHGVGYYYGA